MQILNKPTSKVSQAELQALSGSMSPLIYGGVDRFLKWRNGFILSVAVLMFIRLFFDPDSLPEAFASQNDSMDATHYWQSRALFASFSIVLYLLSYLRNWFYPQVTLIFLTVAVVNLTMDVFNFYVGYDSGLTMGVVMALVLRLLVIGCLFFNALYVHRAPAMPRKFWS